MSKMDAMRAMREARFAQTTSGAAPKRATKAATAKPAPANVAPAKAAKPAEPEAATATDGELCGHRNMSGRSCTRPHGHSEKSHRYS